MFLDFVEVLKEYNLGECLDSLNKTESISSIISNILNFKMIVIHVIKYIRGFVLSLKAKHDTVGKIEYWIWCNNITMHDMKHENPHEIQRHFIVKLISLNLKSNG